MGKSIRSKIKRKFRAIKRVKNDPLEDKQLKEKFIRLKMRSGKSREEVEETLEQEMKEAQKAKEYDDLDVEEKRKRIAKETKEALQNGTMQLEMEGAKPSLDLGEDDDNPFGKNMRSSRRAGPRGVGGVRARAAARSKNSVNKLWNKVTKSNTTKKKSFKKRMRLGQVTRGQS